MAEPPKESVHSALPQKPETTPVIPPRRYPPPSPAGTGPRGESPVIQLRRPPASPLQAGPSPILRPLPKPTGPPLSLSEPATSLLATAALEDFGGSSLQPGPRKETARLNLPPGPSAAITPSAPMITATSKGLDGFDSIPRWFCWSLLGISALIFLIQIWNYALSQSHGKLCCLSNRNAGRLEF